METIETICSRKSVRSFTDEEISSEDLTKVLTAANAAPVGLGQYETMHLTLIKNQDLLKKIDCAGAAMFGNPDAHPLYGAPLLILVSTKKSPQVTDNVAYSNAAIIVQNMILEATDLGIGACHIWGAVAAISTSDEILQALNLPEGFIPCCGVVLGKTDSQYEKREIPLDRISSNTIG